MEYLVDTGRGDPAPEHAGVLQAPRYREPLSRHAPADGVLLGERTEGIAPVARALAFSHAIEHITGANQGGKSAFLRSLGQAGSFMMQAGMFIAAESFTASSIATGVFTYFKREKDATMEKGKLDQELDRMSGIASQITPSALLLWYESFASTRERERPEIARQIIRALAKAGIPIAFVTDLYDLAESLHARHDPAMLFLRAERRPDGTRTFRAATGRAAADQLRPGPVPVSIRNRGPGPPGCEEEEVKSMSTVPPARRAASELARIGC